MGNIGTVNMAVPDPTLNYVPFTYAGTVNAYSLDSSSSDHSSASDNAIANDRSLFVADYALSHSVTWNTLNGNGLIYGKTYETNYTLRSLSMGNVTGATGSPTTNEWDRILDKDTSLIKDWSIRSFGQDTNNMNWSARVARGGSGGVRRALGASVTLSSNGYGFRPALEVLNASTLGSNGLKAVTLNLNGGSLDNKTSIQVVSTGGSITVPSGTGLTPPEHKVFVNWQKTGDPSTTYFEGQTVAYTNGVGLTAVWEYVAVPENTPVIAIDYGNEELTGFEVGGSYEIGGSSVTTVSGKLEVEDYLGETLAIVKKGNGTTTTDSDVQNLVVPTRPATPTTAVAVDPTTIGGTGKIAGVTAAMEYQLAGGTWADVAGTEITNLAVGTYQVRVKATASSFKSGEQTVSLMALIPGAETTPTIAIDYANEELTGFELSGSYTIGGSPVTPVSGKLEVENYLGETLAIVKKGNGSTTTDSAAQSLVIPSRPDTPTATGVDPTTIGGEGTIMGVTTGMEYQSSAGTWTDVTGTEITNLMRGTYHIRVKATATSFKSAEQIIMISAPSEYTVTIGNSGIGSSGSGSYTSGVTVSVYAGSRSGYSFTGWTSTDGVNFANAGSETTSFIMPARNVTVTANWSYNSGSSSGGDSGSNVGSSEITPSITIDKKPDQPTVASMNLTATVDQNGAASVTITEPQVKALIDAANKEAQNKGNTADGIGIVYNIQFGATGSSFGVKLEKGAIALLEKEGVKRFGVNTSLVSFSFDQTAIQEMKSQVSGDVTLGAHPVTELSDAARALVDSRPVYELTVSYQMNSKTEYVTNFGKGTVTLGIFYKTASSEKNGNLYGVYVNNSGKPQLLFNSSYYNSKLYFSRSSLSIYGVGYLLSGPMFSDTTRHWAKDDIDFIVSRGLISGTGATIFSPNTAITRGDFLMVLGKLSGADMSEYKQSSFTDVSSTSPAMPYIEWAVQNKIVQGVGNNRFDPDSQITREQMAVMMVGYAKATSYKLPVSRQTVTFADDAKISSWAKEAIKAIQQTGVVEGKDNNQFDPAGNATRAEASAILRRFVEFVIDYSKVRLE